MESSTISALIVLAILIGAGIFISRKKKGGGSGGRARGGSDSTKNQQR